MSDFIVLPEGVSSLKELLKDGGHIAGITWPDGTSVSYFQDQHGEIYPPDAKEKLAAWYEEFWRDLGRPQEKEPLSNV